MEPVKIYAENQLAAKLIANGWIEIDANGDFWLNPDLIDLIPDDIDPADWQNNNNG